MESEKSLLIPFIFVGVLFALGVGFVFFNSSTVTYQEHTGTVCCLSDSYYVSGAGKGAAEKKMMTIDLDNGRRVDVPIIRIPYIAGGRILIREVKGKIGPHPRFFAARYLTHEDT
jgi:hypothetical protein